MASRLLSALDARIAKCRDPLENTCLRAEKAALLARQGRLDEARAELAVIHARYDSHPNAVVSAWVSLAEGLTSFYSDLSTAARDKMLRAFALSSAVGNQSVRELSAAWLAHMNYLEQDFAPMIRNLSLVLAQGRTTSDAAFARACLVTAQSYHWADRFDLAQPWYSKARQHAASEGDETMLSALMHNMAWLRAAQARRMAVSGRGSREQFLQVLLGAESTDHFDQRIGTASLRSLVPILRAHILTMLDRYADALALFEAHIDTAISEGLGRMQCGMLAEMAWCQLNIGDAVGARRSALHAQGLIVECVQPDESAATHGRLAQLFNALDDGPAARHHRAQAEIDWQLHDGRQVRLIELLSSAPGIAVSGPGAQVFPRS